MDSNLHLIWFKQDRIQNSLRLILMIFLLYVTCQPAFYKYNFRLEILSVMQWGLQKKCQNVRNQAKNRKSCKQRVSEKLNPVDFIDFFLLFYCLQISILKKHTIQLEVDWKRAAFLKMGFLILRSKAFSNQDIIATCLKICPLISKFFLIIWWLLPPVVIWFITSN